MRLRRELLLIYMAAFLRSLGVGLLGVVLGVYLFRIGLDSTQIGLVLAAGLAGGTLATLAVTLHADRLGRRRILLALALVSCLGGLALASAPSLGPLLALAFVGMLNGMGTDRSATFSLEQAIIPGLVADRSRTWAFSWYNLLLDCGGALGALAGGLPLALQSLANTDLATAYRWIFLGYTATQIVAAALYALLSPAVEVAPPATLAQTTSVSAHTKTIVTRLMALFSIDAFGGGFLGDALVSYWFFRRFGIHEQTLGALFFVVHLLNAASHLGAAWLARRIGLVKTMVFTHLPSSVFLIAVPFTPNVQIAVVLFFIRESLVEMDVPTRQSYVAAVVQPHERTFASGATNLTRNVSWAAAASLAGAFMQHVAFSAPLVLGGSLKIFYDLLLWRGFRHLKASEEVAETG
ncbi:MAG: MFS transporter [Terriglobales bacterium]